MKKVLAFSMFFLLSAGLTLYADSVTYNGGEFNVTAALVSGTTYNVTYTANFSGWLGGNQAYIAGINFKFDSNDPTILSLTSTNAAGAWTVFNGTNLSNNGCTGGGSGFVCAQVLPLMSDATSGSYSWLFSATYASPLSADALAGDGNPIRAWFVDADGKGAGLMSLTTTTNVPEPSALILLGSGLIGMAGFARWKMNK